MLTPHVTVIQDIQCELGEGLHWDNNNHLLWLVDILKQQVISIDPQNWNVISRNVPQPVSWVITVNNSDLILVGLKSGIGVMDAKNHQISPTLIDTQFPGNSGLRMNDAKIDLHGQLWCGSMSDTHNSNQLGALARYAIESRTWEVIDNDYLIPNGPAFSPHQSFALHNDSAKHVTYRYDLHAVTGAVQGRRIWREYSKDEGLPDGMTFDAEGFVWIAHWGIGEVRRYDAEGKFDSALTLPALHVTNVCFGGSDLETLFVTSAGPSFGKADEPNNSHAGRVFEITGLGVKGVLGSNAELSNVDR